MPSDIPGGFPMPSRHVQTCLPLWVSQQLKINQTCDWLTPHCSLIDSYHWLQNRSGENRASVCQQTVKRKQLVVAVCGVWGSAKGKTPSMWSSRNIMGKCWSTSVIISKSGRKTAGIQRKIAWRWIWENGMNLLNHWSKLMLKWDNSILRRSELKPIPPTGFKINLQSAFGREDDWMCEMLVLWLYALKG